MSRADVYDRVRQWWDTTVLAGGAQLYCGPTGRAVDVVVAVTHGLAMRLILMQVSSGTPHHKDTGGRGSCALYCGPTGRLVVVAVTHGLAMRLILMQVRGRIDRP
jgi:broad specificity phosphatase PhoE